MLKTNFWQSKTALLLALGAIATSGIPLLITAPTIASSPGNKVGQLISQSSQTTIPEGTVIPVRFEDAERVIVTPDETASLTLTVAANVRSESGAIAIPVGSEIAGELRPANGGTQFVSEELILSNGDRSSINATSSVITETQTITKKSDPNILRGAAIGAAAGAVLGEIFGGIDLGEVLGGAGIGVVAELLLRGSEEVEVVIIEPETDLDLTLQSSFTAELRSQESVLRQEFGEGSLEPLSNQSEVRCLLHNSFSYLRVS